MTTSTLDPVEALQLSAELVGQALRNLTVESLDDDEVLSLLDSAESVGRLIDAARTMAAASVAERSNRWLGHDSLAWKRGCRTGTDLITHVTRVSAREAARRARLGRYVSPRQEMGTTLPPLFPAVAEALTEGALGIDAAEAITTGLSELAPRVEPCRLAGAERALVASATGAITDDTMGLPGEGIAHSADLIRQHVQVWKARLDPDGAAPSDGEADLRSTFGFGELRKGLYPIRGAVTPELRGIMNGVFDAHLSARSGSAGSPSTDHATRFPTAEEQARIEAGELIPGADADLDTRSGAEKRADILRMLLEAAARDPKGPTMGGAAPTVMVHVNATDLADGRGVGWIDGVEAPVSLRTVDRLICAGGYQKILFGTDGQILHLGGKERFFSSQQRRAIAARDGGCIIPGCPVTAAWAEVHHVIPWQHNGPTDVDNGVLLCFYHHATIDTSGWEIRMVNGVPQVRAPRWIEPSRSWRDTARHRVRQTRPLRRVARSTASGSAAPPRAPSGAAPPG